MAFGHKEEKGGRHVESGPSEQSRPHGPTSRHETAGNFATTTGHGRSQPADRQESEDGTSSSTKPPHSPGQQTSRSVREASRPPYTSR